MTTGEEGEMERRPAPDVERLRKVERRRRRALDLGVVLVCVGVGCFDWRFGVIAFGVVLMVAALVGNLNVRGTPRAR